MTWEKAKDALICGGCALGVFFLSEMRSDFRALTQAVSDINLKLQRITDESVADNDELRDHEARLRRMEAARPHAHADI